MFVQPDQDHARVGGVPSAQHLSVMVIVTADKPKRSAKQDLPLPV